MAIEVCCYLLADMGRHTANWTASVVPTNTIQEYCGAEYEGVEFTSGGGKRDAGS
jgi:hypothetical protein